MKNLIYVILFYSLSFSQDTIGENLYLNNLIEFIQDNYTTTDVLSYNGARDVLYGYIDNNNGSVSCIYTNYTVNNIPTNDPRPVVYNGGIDCEHVWPQSLYSGTSPMKSDLHHLRPAKSNINSSRGNKPYNEIADFETDNWYWLNYSTSSIPSSNINEYSESKSGNFEPREDRKGDVARAIFYFYTIYNNVADDDFFNTQKDILYEWHNQDPVTVNEINRTWQIASYQNNIPNPFIVDESLIYRAYFFNTQLGDANLDSIVNVVDVVLLVSYIFGESDLSEEQFSNADIDNNSIINVSDIIALIDIILS